MVSTLLYFGRAVDPTLMAALNAIATKQAKCTHAVSATVHQLLDYVATHPNLVIWYLARNMILALHTDGLYLSELEEKSRSAGYILFHT